MTAVAKTVTEWWFGPDSKRWFYRRIITTKWKVDNKVVTYTHEQVNQSWGILDLQLRGMENGELAEGFKKSWAHFKKNQRKVRERKLVKSKSN